MNHYCTCHLVQKALEENGAVDRQIGQAVKKLGEEKAQMGWEGQRKNLLATFEKYPALISDLLDSAYFCGVETLVKETARVRAEAFAEVVVMIEGMKKGVQITINGEAVPAISYSYNSALSDLLAKITSKK